MELDDLKQAWQSLDRQMQKQNALQLQHYRESKLRGIGKTLRPLFWGQLVQMAFGLGFVLLGVWMWRIGHGVAMALFITRCSGPLLYLRMSRSMPCRKVSNASKLSRGWRG